MCEPCAEFVSGMIAAAALLSGVMVLWHLVCWLQAEDNDQDEDLL